MINLSDPLERLRAVNPCLLTGSDAAAAGPGAVPSHHLRRAAAGPRPDRADAGAPAAGARRWSPPASWAAPWPTPCSGARSPSPENGGLLRVGPTSTPDTAVASVDEPTGRSPPAPSCGGGARSAPGARCPPLAECVLDSGVAGVFPATAGARRLQPASNLPPVARRPRRPPTSPAPTSQPPSDLERPGARVPRRGRRPVPRQPVRGAARTAGAIVRRELDRAGLTDWTIRGGEGLAATASRPSGRAPRCRCGRRTGRSCWCPTPRR